MPAESELSPVILALEDDGKYNDMATQTLFPVRHSLKLKEEAEVALITDDRHALSWSQVTSHG